MTLNESIGITIVVASFGILTAETFIYVNTPPPASDDVNKHHCVTTWTTLGKQLTSGEISLAQAEDELELACEDHREDISKERYTPEEEV